MTPSEGRRRAFDYGKAISDTRRVSSAGSLGIRRYRSPLREARASDTRRRVIEAAGLVFLARGYGATTVRAVASAAGVSVPTVEALFGSKARLLKAAIDVAIAGNAEPVAVLEQPWVEQAEAAPTIEAFLSIVARILAAAQERSAGLVLAVFEGSPREAELEQLAAQLVTQRSTTAAWIVERVTRLAPLDGGCVRAEAVDTVWLLMDPAVFRRLTREKNWSVERYRRWWAAAIARLLTSGPRLAAQAGDQR